MAPYFLKLMVSMVEPGRGTIFDPCCGFGSLLVESINFIKEKGKSLKKIKFYGHENRMTLFQLCCMHLALYGIDIKHMKWYSDMSINMDKHSDLKADFILCAPPYNNLVLPWIYYVLSHLSHEGCVAVLIAKDSLFPDKGNGDRINKELIHTNFVDYIVNVPDKLVPIAGISLSILILALDRVLKKGRHRYRKDTGFKLSDFLLKQKMYVSSVLLVQKSELTVKKIAETIGFCSVDYFTILFKRFFGITPGRFRYRLKIIMSRINEEN